MSTGTDRHASVKTAIAEVLDAEREALAELAACDSRAEQMLAEARHAVRAMVRRTQQRISRVHAACALKTRDMTERIERDAGGYDSCSVPAEREQQLLRQVVRDVARELTTPEHRRDD